jgi:hypothetical protein
MLQSFHLKTVIQTKHGVWNMAPDLPSPFILVNKSHPGLLKVTALLVIYLFRYLLKARLSLPLGKAALDQKGLQSPDTGEAFSGAGEGKMVAGQGNGGKAGV